MKFFTNPPQFYATCKAIYQIYIGNVMFDCRLINFLYQFFIIGRVLMYHECACNGKKTKYETKRKWQLWEEHGRLMDCSSHLCFLVIPFSTFSETNSHINYADSTFSKERPTPIMFLSVSTSKATKIMLINVHINLYQTLPLWLVIIYILSLCSCMHLKVFIQNAQNEAILSYSTTGILYIS